MELTASALRSVCDAGRLRFATTDELPDGPLVLGQDRAVGAIQFGIGIRRAGYNAFALGPARAGKHTVVRRFLEAQAALEPAARDWCYVNNFEQPHRPRALSLPKGLGLKFRDDIARLIEELGAAIMAALETDEFRQRHQQIHQQFESRRDEAIDDLRRRAADEGVAVVRTPMGMALAPMQGGKIIEAADFEAQPEQERERIALRMKAYEDELEAILAHIPKWHRESREQLRNLQRQATGAAVQPLIDELKRTYAGEPAVVAHLTALHADVIEHADRFRRTKDNEEPITLAEALASSIGASSPTARYRVNVLEDHGVQPGGPVVYEDKPTFQNLIGRIEHVSQMGTLVTDFTHIRAGALHRANGGYLILDARRVLVEPFAWEGLKRALRARTIRVESVGELLSLVSTISLEPEPIPLDVKVVLIGDRAVYYLLYELDPDFRELFKVAVDFESSLDRSERTEEEYARLLATLARRAGLRPLSAAGVARVIEEGARTVGDAGKLWIELDRVTDLLQEADYWAGRAGRTTIDADAVQQAVEARLGRAGRPQTRLIEEIMRGTVMIDTAGAIPGQVNGLSVVDLGGVAFGRPSRITARVRLGSGTVVDIEREVELGGPIHSKGVLILSGFLAGRYVPDAPLSLSASLVFEQSYGAVEGDSASAAELCALLSALADVPARQSLAVTGSINQHGSIQPVGSVNEKIEGFFDVCRARGLNGDQGVLVPAANKHHLMLRRDVVEAVAAGRFHVYAVETVDEALEVLTGVPAGARAADGAFPEGTLNRRVEARLEALARQARAFRMGGEEKTAKSR
jgi:predicted ATP-dependent protease